jgi:hypothetical protein
VNLNGTPALRLAASTASRKACSATLTSACAERDPCPLNLTTSVSTARGKIFALILSLSMDDGRALP